MGQKATPSKSGFQHLTSMSTILEVYWWGSGGEKSPDWLMVRVHVRYLSVKIGPKQRLSTQATRVVPFTPNFARSLVLWWRFSSRQKRSCTDLLSRPLSQNYAIFEASKHDQSLTAFSNNICSKFTYWKWHSTPRGSRARNETANVKHPFYNLQALFQLRSHSKTSKEILEISRDKPHQKPLDKYCQSKTPLKSGILYDWTGWEHFARRFHLSAPWNFYNLHCYTIQKGIMIIIDCILKHRVINLVTFWLSASSLYSTRHVHASDNSNPWAPKIRLHVLSLLIIWYNFLLLGF